MKVCQRGTGCRRARHPQRSRPGWKPLRGSCASPARNPVRLKPHWAFSHASSVADFATPDHPCDRPGLPNSDWSQNCAPLARRRSHLCDLHRQRGLDPVRSLAFHEERWRHLFWQSRAAYRRPCWRSHAAWQRALVLFETRWVYRSSVLRPADMFSPAFAHPALPGEIVSGQERASIQGNTEHQRGTT